MNCWNTLEGNQQRNLYFFKETFNDYPRMRSRVKRSEAEDILKG
nr:MAG TPA: hypothetical protein [Caudoviricetes sp.]